MSVFSGPYAVSDGLVFAYDFGNFKSYSTNIIPTPTDLFATYGNFALNNAVISRDTIQSPVGTTPLKMVPAGTDPHIGTLNFSVCNLGPAAAGQTWTISCYAKSNTASEMQFFVVGAKSDGVAFENAISNWRYLTFSTLSTTTAWQRFSHTFTIANANNSYPVEQIQMRLDGPDSGNAITWFDGLQLERVDTATTFNPKRNTNGNTVFDLASSSTGAVVSFPLYSAANGGSLSFDGTDDYVDINKNLGTLSSYTISFWAKRDAEDRMAFCSRGSTNFYWFGDNSWSYTHGGVGGELYYSKPTTIGVGTWGYYVVTYDGSAIKIYRQGIYQDQQSTTGTANFTSGITLGTFNGVAGYWFLGNIATFQMYNRALSADEVLQNFNATRSRFGI